MKDKELLKELKEIFFHVADAVDGGETVPKHLRDAYLKALKVSAVAKFYSKSIQAML